VKRFFRQDARQKKNESTFFDSIKAETASIIVPFGGESRLQALVICAASRPT
jgi:hypothetical protein